MHPLWSAIFGNDAPVEVEIGPGTGTFILAAATESPDVNFYGVEHSRARATRLQDAICTRGLGNVRVINGDAACVVSALLPAACVRAYHVYFPDPWWKRRHHRRRLFTPAFAAALARTLVAGGEVHVATDVEETFALILQTLAQCGAFSRDGVRRPRRNGPTAFERKGLARGALIREATFVKSTVEPPLRRSHASSAAPITPAESPS